MVLTVILEHHIHADTGIAMLDLQISTLGAYFDDGDHELVWQINVGGNQTTGAGSVTLWIDGQLLVLLKHKVVVGQV